MALLWYILLGFVIFWVGGALTTFTLCYLRAYAGFDRARHRLNRRLHHAGVRFAPPPGRVGELGGLLRTCLLCWPLLLWTLFILQTLWRSVNEAAAMFSRPVDAEDPDSTLLPPHAPLANPATFRLCALLLFLQALDDEAPSAEPRPPADPPPPAPRWAADNAHLN